MTIQEIKQEVQSVITSKQGIEDSITPEDLGGLLSDMCDFASQSSVTVTDITIENLANIRTISAETLTAQTINVDSIIAGDANIGGKTASNLITSDDSGDTNCLAVFNGIKKITNGPKINSDGSDNMFLSEKGNWVSPDALNYTGLNGVTVNNTASTKTIKVEGYVKDNGLKIYDEWDLRIGVAGTCGISGESVTIKSIEPGVGNEPSLVELSDTKINIESANVNINGNTTVGTTASTKNLTVTGNANIRGNASITGDTTIGTTANTKNLTVSGNTNIYGNATAKVNGVDNVELGLPIGSITMWAGSTAPTGWLLCAGQSIVISNATATADLKGIEFDNLYNVLATSIGAGGVKYLPDLRLRFPIGYNNISRYDQIKRVFDACGFIFSFDDLVNSNGYFKVLATTQMLNRAAQDALISRLSDFYNIPITATSHDDRVTEINGKTIFGIGTFSGELAHKLTVGEMPSHAHSVLVDKDSSTGHTKPALPDGSSAGTSAHPINQTTTDETDYSKDTDNDYGTAVMYSEGNDLAHNNTPPFFAVNFIIKYK